MSEKKTVVVTGGSTGIGKSICEQLLSEGYVVVNLS
ncbi:MAG: NAD(P)-dependent dehydrogenase (short-subunit alcohol dehydrogenase family), partial [Arenicella sp.]